MTRLPVKGAIAGLTVACALLVSVPASAQRRPPRAFVKAYDAGKDAYNLGDYDKARAELERAARIVPTAPGPHRYLAVTAVAQKRWEPCLVHVVDYLKRADADSKYAANLREVHRRCRAELGRREFVGTFPDQAGAIAITSNADSAEITVNGLSFGATPLAPRTLAMGTVEVEATAEGYTPGRLLVEIVPGLVTDVNFELELDPDYVPKTVEPVEEAPEAPVEEVGWLRFFVTAPDASISSDGAAIELDDQGRWRRPPGVYVVRIEAPGYEPWTRRVRVARGQDRSVQVDLKKAGQRSGGETAGWALFGVAAAFTATGIVFDVLESDAREEAQDIFDIESRRPATDADGDIIPVRTREDLEDANDRARRNAAISGIAYGLAAASLGVSLYFLIDARGDERRGAPPPFAIVPTTDATGGTGAAAVISGEFDW